METKDAKKRKILQNDKQFLKDGMSTSDIRKTIQQIRSYIEKGGAATLEERAVQLREQHAFFAERYPMLFDMCTQREFNYDHLNYFLTKRDEIINDTISSEDASKKVGKEWFDKFVDVSKLDKEK